MVDQDTRRPRVADQQGRAGDAIAADPADHKATRDLVSSLKSIGVKIVITNHVTDQAGGEWDPSRTQIRLRPSTVAMGSRVLSQALAHESAHVAQSCRAGGLRRQSEPMGIEVNPAANYQHQLDAPIYKGPPSSKAIELEAFSVGANPAWAVTVLNHYCKSRN
jgi:hypothetical protein